jgi:ABC-type glycerol-3-phosphate transport system substrate-binding protein
LFAAFGAEVITAKGEVNVRSDAVRQALEYAQQLVRHLPDDAVSYDDASNNRALISGRSALIWNPPSAWAVARRDAPQVAADCWTFLAPKGPKGRFLPLGAFSWTIWNFSANKTAAKELIEYLSRRENVEARCVVALGHDVPPFASMTDFRIWDEVAPPTGTVYHYPVRKSHHQENCIAVAPAPPEIAVQVHNRGTLPTMLARLQSGQSVQAVQDWAEDELEGFVR